MIIYASNTAQTRSAPLFKYLKSSRKSKGIKIQIQKNNKEEYIYIDTALDSEVPVYAKVGRQKNGTLKITYHNPEVEVAEEKII